MRITAMDTRETLDAYEAYAAGRLSEDSALFRSFLPVTVDCLAVQVHRRCADDEPMDRLAKRTMYAPGGTTEICTAAELVRLCYWVRDHGTRTAFVPPERGMGGVVSVDPGSFVGLPSLRIVVREVRVMDANGTGEYARWSADELAAVIEEIRATARRPPVDPAE